jgi:hypothetical protein
VASARDENGFGWTDPAFLEAAHAWIRDRCAVIGPIEQPHLRPWATALRVPTADGVLWFKACVEALAHEIALLELLEHESLPRVIAADASRGWMLLDDAGQQVYERADADEHWETFVAAYARLQIDVAPFADELVQAGVPDARTPALLAAFERVVDEEGLALRGVLPSLRAHADRLDSLDVPHSAQHDDVHLWNVFLRDGRYVFLDWGDACVSHPLLSLGVPLAHAPARLQTRIRDAFLEPWTSFARRDELVAAAESALVLASVTAVLKWSRIHYGLAPEVRPAYDESLPALAAALEAACA